MNFEQTQLVLDIVKARLNRLASDTGLDDYLRSRIQAAASELEATGIVIDTADTRDTVLLADIVVWQYQNRDKPGPMPQWLSLARRERWLQQRPLDAGVSP
jgi:hypothetical protein